EGGYHMAFRRPVLVLQRAIVALLEEAGDRWGNLQLLACGDDFPKSLENGTLAERRLGDLLQRNKWHEHASHRPVREKPNESRRVAPQCLGDQDERSASTPGREHLLEGNIKAQRRELERRSFFAQFRIPDLP